MPQQPGQQGMAAADPNMLKNLMMLQAIKAGGMGGATPPPPATGMPPMNQQMAPGMGMGMSPPPMMPQPVNPANMQGGLAQAPQDPVAAALMSQIPGGGQ